MEKFNQLYYELRTKGDVLVGKHRSIFKAGSILIFQLDNAQTTS